jgi:hypothetical protein
MHKELVRDELEARRRSTKSNPLQLQPLYLKNQEHLSQLDLAVVASKKVLLSTPSSPSKKRRLQCSGHAAANPKSSKPPNLPKPKIPNRMATPNTFLGHRL